MKRKRPIFTVISMLIDFAAAMLYIFGVCPELAGDASVPAKAVICAAAAAAIYLLTLIPYLGRAFQLAAGAALCRAVFDIADAYGNGALSALKEKSFALWLAAAAAIFAVCLCLHLRKTVGEGFGAYFVAPRDDNEEEAEPDFPDDNDGGYDEDFDGDFDDERVEEDEEYDEEYGDAENSVNENIRLMAAASDVYTRASDKTRRYFDDVKSGEYLISGEQLTVISGIAEEFEQLAGKASDIFTAFDNDGGSTDMSQGLCAVSERMESLSSIMENVIKKLPRADAPREAKEQKTEFSAYFNGCTTLDELKKRYKSLSKIFHPDTEMGDNESMQRINDEFERMKRALRRK